MISQAYGHPMRIFDLRFHPLDGSILASGSDDTSVRVWKIDKGTGAMKQILCCLGQHTAEVTRVAWSPDGSMLASGSADGSVCIWESPPTHSNSPSYASKLIYSLRGHPEEVYHVEFIPMSPDDESGRILPRVLVASSESLYSWDLEKQEILQKADAPGTSGSKYTAEEAYKAGYKGAYIFGCARQPGGRLISTACSDGALRLWAMDEDGFLSFLHCAKIDPLHDRVGGNGNGSGRPMMLTSCSFDSTGDRLACSARDGMVFVLDVKSMSVLRTVRVPDAPTFSCCFIRERNDDEGEMLAVPGSRGQLTLINLTSPGRPPISLKPGFGFKSPLLVATCCMDQEGEVLIAMAGEAQMMAPFLTLDDQGTDQIKSSQPSRRRGRARKRDDSGSIPSAHGCGKQLANPRSGLALLDEICEEKGPSEDDRGEASDPDSAMIRAPIFLYRLPLSGTKK